MTSGGTVATRSEREGALRGVPSNGAPATRVLPPLDERTWAKFRKLLVAEVTRIGAYRSPDILEYGSGEGALGSLALAHAGYASIGIDASEDGIRRARTAAEYVNGGVRPLYLAMNPEHLDFGDGAFDVVCGTGVLHRLNLGRALSEVARVLRPSGSAVFVEPLGRSPLRSRDLPAVRNSFGLVDVHAGAFRFLPRVRRQVAYGVLRLGEPRSYL